VMQVIAAWWVTPPLAERGVAACIPRARV
jgi:hypothetical protein